MLETLGKKKKEKKKLPLNTVLYIFFSIKIFIL